MYTNNRNNFNIRDFFMDLMNINLKRTFLIVYITQIILFILTIIIGNKLINFIIFIYFILGIYGYFVTDNKKMLPALVGIILSILLFFSFNIINIILSIYLGYQSYKYYMEVK